MRFIRGVLFLVIVDYVMLTVACTVYRSKLYRRLTSDQTIGAECRRAFIDLLQNLVQWVYSNANKLPVNQILDVILR